MKEGGQDNFDEVMTLSETEVMFWKKMNIDPFFMYVEDSIKYVDQSWVEHNRKVLEDLKISVKNNEDEEIGHDDSADYIIHAVLS